MSALLLLFVVAVINVFAMAFQSRNVNSGHYMMAAAGSMAIGMSQAFVWKHVVMDGMTEALVYSIGGGCGSITAMWVHARFIGERKPHG